MREKWVLFEIGIAKSQNYFGINVEKMINSHCAAKKLLTKFFQRFGALRNLAKFCEL